MKRALLSCVREMAIILIQGLPAEKRFGIYEIQDLVKEAVDLLPEQYQELVRDLTDSEMLMECMQALRRTPRKREDDKWHLEIFSSNSGCVWSRHIPAGVWDRR